MVICFFGGSRPLSGLSCTNPVDESSYWQTGGQVCGFDSWFFLSLLLLCVALWCSRMRIRVRARGTRAATTMYVSDLRGEGLDAGL